MRRTPESGWEEHVLDYDLRVSEVRLPVSDDPSAVITTE